MKAFRSASAVLLLASACGPKAGPPTEVDVSKARAAFTANELANVVDVSEVAIAPDGSELAFVTDRSGAYELWTMRINRGVAGEPKQRTTANEQVSGLVYSPNGQELFFEIDEGGNERTDLWALRKGDAEVPRRIGKTDTAEHAVDFSPDGTRIAYVADPDRPFRFNVFVMDLRTRAVTQLTREAVNVLQPTWDHEGKTIAATVTPDDQKGELLLIDVATGAVKRIASPVKDGILWPVDFLPSGQLVAIGTNAKGFQQLATIDPAKGKVVFVGDGDWDVEGAALAEDGTILFSRNVRGESEVTAARRLGWKDEIRSRFSREGVVGSLSIARIGGRGAMVREASNRPSEIVLVEISGSGTSGPATVEARSTTILPASAGSVRVDALARAERRTFPSFDGTKIDAFVYRPRVARLGWPAPAVVHVHGGPNGQARGGFSPQIQALTEAGFVVVAPNYRGSTGYGRAFEDLNNKDWGGGDLQDLVAVVKAMAAAGEIDGGRVGVTGGSYGGYMTLRAITAEPAFFRAAVESFGMPDLVVDYELTVDRFGSWYETEMGTPSTHAALFRERSPIHALDRVTSPLLVLQGANDTNVPQKESDLVVEALRKRGQTVDYTVYPNEGHGFTRRENRLDAMTRTVDFFVKHLGKPAAAPAAATTAGGS